MNADCEFLEMLWTSKSLHEHAECQMDLESLLDGRGLLEEGDGRQIPELDTRTDMEQCLVTSWV